MTESKRALSEYVYQSKYSLFREDLGRKETWDESVERIRQMHLTHLERFAPPGAARRVVHDPVQ